MHVLRTFNNIALAEVDYDSTLKQTHHGPTFGRYSISPLSNSARELRSSIMFAVGHNAHFGRGVSNSHGITCPGFATQWTLMLRTPHFEGGNFIDYVAKYIRYITLLAETIFEYIRVQYGLSKIPNVSYM
jgi:hypothetical protein